MVVHTLARGAIFLPSRYAFESLRHCISSLLLNEMNQAFVCQKKKEFFFCSLNSCQGRNQKNLLRVAKNITNDNQNR
jgi:hypothetical protein